MSDPIVTPDPPGANPPFPVQAPDNAQSWDHLLCEAPFGLFRMDATGRILQVNTTLSAMLGYDSPQDLLDAEVPVWSATQAEELEAMLATFSGPGWTRREDLLWPHRSGRLVPVCVTVRRSAAPAEGMMLEGFVQDITDHVRELNQLRESEYKYRAMIEISNDVIFCVDKNGYYQYANHVFASTLGKTPEYFQGKSFWDIYPKEHADHRFAASSIVFETGQPGSVEVVVPLPDRTLYYLAKTNPVRDPEGNVIMNLTHAVDITENKLAEKERRNLEAQLLQAQKLESLGVLAGGIAHDFNNILMAILGFAELAQQGLPPAAPGQSDLAEIIKASKRAAELVRQMLAYAGQTRLAKERLDLAGVVDEVARMIEMAVSKRADLVISSTKVPPINADASQMSQIVMNLVLNAAEAGSSRRNRITVWTGVRHYDRAALDMAVIGQELPAGQYVTLEVSDDGDGMDGETASRVFEPFFTTKFTGRGLGLAAVHGIVRSHQGAILLRSGPGQGTTFTILFPIADPLTVPAEEKAHPTMTPAPATPSARGSGTLLLIDDEETARTVGRRMLENLGYEVLTASSGAEGINAYRSHEKQIRAVVLDYLMPHMDGAIVLDEIRSANPEAKIVLSTGQGEDEVCDRFKNAGLSGVIHKPYSMEQLASTLASVLR